MDHQAFAQLLGNYGEFVGAIAVVITLVYLSIQVKHSKDATEFNSRQVEQSNLLALSQNQIPLKWLRFLSDTNLKDWMRLTKLNNFGSGIGKSFSTTS